MAAFFRHPLTRPFLTRSLPLGGAVALGIMVFLLVATMSGVSLEALVSASGIAALVPGAQPPLGATARLLLALGSGVVAAALGWAVLYLLFGPGGPFAASGPRADGVQTVRRADAHPDAPPRRPLSAAHELAAPPAPVVAAPAVAVQPLPADLDVPLASFDPHSILPVPREAVRPVPPLATVTPPVLVATPALAPGERLETFALTPTSRPAPPEPSDEPPSIDALLRRLEQGAERRVRPGR